MFATISTKVRFLNVVEYHIWLVINIVNYLLMFVVHINNESSAWYTSLRGVPRRDLLQQETFIILSCYNLEINVWV